MVQSIVPPSRAHPLPPTTTKGKGRVPPQSPKPRPEGRKKVAQSLVFAEGRDGNTGC